MTDRRQVGESLPADGARPARAPTEWQITVAATFDTSRLVGGDAGRDVLSRFVVRRANRRRRHPWDESFFSKVSTSAHFIGA